MWMFTRYGFFSVASGGKNGKELMIRARARKHLEALQNRLPYLKKYSIIINAATDYRYRIIVPKNTWVDAMLTLIVEQRWGNFKNEAKQFQHDPIYDKALMKVWSEMRMAGYDWEEEEEKNAELPLEAQS